MVQRNMVPESFNIPHTAWKKKKKKIFQAESYGVILSSVPWKSRPWWCGESIWAQEQMYAIFPFSDFPCQLLVSSLTLCGSTALMELRCFSLTHFVKVTAELFTSCDGFSNVSLSHNNQPAERGSQDLEVTKRHQSGHQARSRRLQTDTQISKIIFFNCGF